MTRRSNLIRQRFLTTREPDTQALNIRSEWCTHALRFN
jgi:hypothetical protein